MPSFIGRLEEAIVEAEKACQLGGRNSRSLGLLAAGYGFAGRQDEARALLNELMIRSRTTHVPAYAMVAAYSGLGEPDHCLEWLEKAVEERDLMIVACIQVDENITSFFGGHPRFHALLRKMNLEP